MFNWLFKKKLSYDNQKVSAYELYKALLFLETKIDINFFNLKNYGHHYEKDFVIDILKFEFNTIASSPPGENYWYTVYCKIYITDGYNSHQIASMKSENKRVDKYYDFEDMMITKDFGYIVVEKDSPISESELKKYLRNLIDEYRYKANIKRSEHKLQSNKESQERLERRNEVFNIVKENKGKLFK